MFTCDAVVTGVTGITVARVAVETISAAAMEAWIRLAFVDVYKVNIENNISYLNQLVLQYFVSITAFLRDYKRRFLGM